MLVKVLKTESLKLKRSPIWIAFFSLPLLAAVMGTFNYVQNIGILNDHWNSLWTQHTLFACFFFLPSLIGILCAYEWRVEHFGNNWNTLLTMPTSCRTVFLGKLVTVGKMIVFIQVLTGLLFVASGKMAGLSGLPSAEVITQLIMGGCAAIAIASLQLLLSMRIKSFAVPVVIALLGGILGLMFSNMGLGMFWPYSLLSMGMNANGRGDITPENTITFFAMCILFTLVFSFLAVRSLKRSDN